MYESLTTLERSETSANSRDEIISVLRDSGVDSPVQAFNGLFEEGLLQAIGDRFGLSNSGIRASILLDALNGGDVSLAYRRLSAVDPSVQSYQLVREGMTDTFLENIQARPGFVRLYLCSPWIRLSSRSQDLLSNALQLARSRGEPPELLVMTRPDNNGEAPAGIAPLTELGATVFLNPRLHSKLYIREPGRRGTYSMAIVGSENLTLSTYLELGIRINSDSAMIDRLIKYFWTLSYDSREVGRQT